MRENKVKVVRIIDHIQPAFFIIRINGLILRSYISSVYFQKVITLKNINILQITVRRNLHTLRSINITNRSMTTDRQYFFCSMFQELEIYLCRPYRINKNTNTVSGKSDYRIRFIIFPGKCHSAIIFCFTDRCPDVITFFRILYSHKSQTDIHDISCRISADIIVPDSCTARFVIFRYTDSFRITVAPSMIRECFPVLIIASKSFI